MVFVFLEVDIILGNGCRVLQQNYLAQLQKSEMSPGLLQDFIIGCTMFEKHILQKQRFKRCLSLYSCEPRSWTLQFVYCVVIYRVTIYRLVNVSLSKHITRDAFDSTLNLMIDRHLANLNIGVKGKVCLYQKNPVRLMMIQLIINMLIL